MQQHGDKVIVRVKKQASDDRVSGKHFRAEGEVIRILERAVKKIVGTFGETQKLRLCHPR